MTTVVIVIHLMVVLAMIGLILLQRSEGGALGIGGGQGAFMSNRSAGNVLSHTTAYLALAFFLTSLGLAFIAKYESKPSDILERLPGVATPASQPQTPAEPMAPPTNAQDLLKELNSTTGGPQTPPPPAANGSSAPGGSATPAPAPSGAASPPSPASATPAPASGSSQPAAPTPSTAPAPQPAPAPSP